MLAQVLLSNMLHCEHRQILQILVRLGFALGCRDMEAARRLAGALSAVAGPHFRAEEELLCPALSTALGEEYVEQILSAHDGFVASAQQLAELVREDALSNGEAQEGLRLVTGLACAVAECDKLPCYLGQISDADAKRILTARGRVLQENLDLWSWSRFVRQRGVTEATAH